MSEIQQKLMDLGQRLIQTQGYNAFSYRDLAKEAGITTASIHYHFPTKADFALAIAVRHREAVEQFFQDMDVSTITPAEKIHQFGYLFVETLHDRSQMCLCGILAMELESLNEALRQEVRLFFEICEKWLVQQLQAGIKAKEFSARKQLPAEARNIMASLEGSMLIARLMGEESRLTEAIDQMLLRLKLKN